MACLIPARIAPPSLWCRKAPARALSGSFDAPLNRISDLRCGSKPERAAFARPKVALGCRGDYATENGFMGRGTKAVIAISVLAGLGVVAAQFLTIFVIQPIGALPEGRTLVISRLNTLNFIDSADAWCDRKLGGVSLLCRMSALSNCFDLNNISSPALLGGALFDQHRRGYL